jgi:hypothetical protein
MEKTIFAEPFGKWATFEDCVKEQMSEGKDRDSASRICASIHKKITGKWPSEQSYHSKLEKLHDEFMAIDKVGNKIRGLTLDDARKFALKGWKIEPEDDRERRMIGSEEHIKEDYLGWKNWDTWSVMLWLTDDENSYNQARKLAKDKNIIGLQQLAKKLVKDDVDMNIVDWKGIADALSENVGKKIEKLHEYLVKNPIQELPKDAVRKERIMARINHDGKEINMAFEDEEQMNKWLSENPEAKLVQVMGKVKHDTENLKEEFKEEKKRKIKKIEIKQVEGEYGDPRLNKKFVFSNIDEVERHLLDSKMPADSVWYPSSSYYKHDVWITYDDGTVEKRRYDHGLKELPFGQQLGLEENVNLKEQSERPPKDWWDKCVDRVKSGKPDYTDEQVNAICGSMWYHGWGMGEMFDGKSYSERIDDIHKEMVLKK